MVGVEAKENEFDNQELEMTRDDVWGWEWVVAVVVSSRLGVSWSPWKQGAFERTFLAPDVHRTNFTIPGRTELQAGGGTGLWTAELWQKPTVGYVQVVTGEGTQGKPKSISHNLPVLVYLLLQRCKPKNSVSINLFPMWETSQLGLCLI